MKGGETRGPITWRELKRAVESDLVRQGVDDPDELVVGSIDIEPRDLLHADLLVAVRGRTLSICSQVG